MLEKFDQDGDGQLSPQEKKQAHKERILKQFDGNGDGTLDATERDAAREASSGQARSLLLALVLASLDIYREETNHSAVALLDDLDSELDHERTHALCTEVASRAQTLVTSAHPAWAQSLRSQGQLFHVSAGKVQPA